MKVVVLDEKKQRNSDISDIAKQKGHKVVSCFGSNDFFDAVQESPERLIVDLTSWNNGAVINKYFDIASKISEIPVIFYNTPENYAQASGREGCDSDVYITSGSEKQEIVEAI